MPTPTTVSGIREYAMRSHPQKMERMRNALKLLRRATGNPTTDKAEARALYLKIKVKIARQERANASQEEEERDGG